LSQINELKANIYNLQEKTNRSSITINPFSGNTNTTSVISNITTNNNSIIPNNNINNKSVISNNSTKDNSIINRNVTNDNNEENENNDYFDKRIVKHAPIKRQPLGKRSSLLDSEDLVSELKNENKELQKNIEILKKKLAQGITQASKDMEFNPSKIRIYILNQNILTLIQYLKIFHCL
jgi:hypothetical protein